MCDVISDVKSIYLPKCQTLAWDQTYERRINLSCDRNDKQTQYSPNVRMILNCNSGTLTLNLVQITYETIIKIPLCNKTITSATTITMPIFTLNRHQKLADLYTSIYIYIYIYYIH